MRETDITTEAICIIAEAPDATEGVRKLLETIFQNTKERWYKHKIKQRIALTILCLVYRLLSNFSNCNYKILTVSGK